MREARSNHAINIIIFCVLPLESGAMPLVVLPSLSQPEEYVIRDHQRFVFVRPTDSGAHLPPLSQADSNTKGISQVNTNFSFSSLATDNV